MSLDDDNRSLLVKMQMEKSRNEMITAELLLDASCKGDDRHHC